MWRGRRDDRQERRDERGPGSPSVWTRYQMRQKLLAFGDDFYIENEHGQKVYKVDGKVLRVRDTLVFRDMYGQEQCKIQERMLRIKDTMDIEAPNGEQLATVKKALFTPLRERWVVKIGNGPDLDVQGNILDHEYAIGEGRDKIAEVSRRWFRIRDTYGVEIEPGHNDVLILAVSVAVDMMAHGRH